jgi:hypothetical protein
MLCTKITEMTNVCAVADRAETSGKFLLLGFKLLLMLKNVINFQSILPNTNLICNCFKYSWLNLLIRYLALANDHYHHLDFILCINSKEFCVINFDVRVDRCVPSPTVTHVVLSGCFWSVQLVELATGSVVHYSVLHSVCILKLHCTSKCKCHMFDRCTVMIMII